MTRKSPSREVYAALNVKRLPRRRHWGRFLFFLLLLLLTLTLLLSLYLRNLMRSAAAAEARDRMTRSVGETLERLMEEEGWEYSDLITLERGPDGTICAFTTNAARINRISARFLREMMAAADAGELDLHISLGDLLGTNFLFGRSPQLLVPVSMMTSPDLNFSHSFTSTGVNQTRHALTLLAAMDLDLFIPWGAVSTRVETEILLTETIIVGRVPDTYIYREDSHGQTGSRTTDFAPSGGGQ